MSINSQLRQTRYYSIYYCIIPSIVYLHYKPILDAWVRYSRWIWIWIVSRQGSVLEHHTDEELRAYGAP